MNKEHLIYNEQNKAIIEEISKNYTVVLTEASNEFLYGTYKEMFDDCYSLSELTVYFKSFTGGYQPPFSDHDIIGTENWLYEAGKNVDTRKFHCFNDISDSLYYYRIIKFVFLIQ